MAYAEVPKQSAPSVNAPRKATGMFFIGRTAPDAVFQSALRRPILS